MLRNLTMQAKMIILVACSTFMMMTIVIWFDTFMLKRSVEEAYTSQLHGITTAINSRYEESHSAVHVQQTFDYIYDKNEDVLELVLYGEQRVEAATEKVRIGQPIPSNLLQRMDDHQFEVQYLRVEEDHIPKVRLTAPLYNKGDIIGAIEMTLDVSSTQSLIQKRTNAAILVGLIATVIFMSFLSLVIRRLVVVPLRKIHNAAQNVQQGRDYEALNLESSSEFKEVSIAFNEMVMDIEKRYTQLQNALETIKSTQKQLVESEKMVALGRLVAGVSHEINTPLGIGVTASSYLEEKTQTFMTLYHQQKMKRSDLEQFLNTVQETSSMIQTNLLRASELVKSFKQVAVDRSQEGKRMFAVKPYMEEILVSLSPRLKNTGHQVTIVGDDHLQIYSDPGAVAQVVTNLIMNSLTHAFTEKDAGEMRLVLSRQHDHLTIVYSDNGKGMTQDVMQHIFEPFFTTNRGGGGTGLGMHIVYNLVTQSLDGTIRCESELGRGTWFTINIPIHAREGGQQDAS